RRGSSDGEEPANCLSLYRWPSYKTAPSALSRLSSEDTDCRSRWMPRRSAISTAIRPLSPVVPTSLSRSRTVSFIALRFLDGVGVGTSPSPSNSAIAISRPMTLVAQGFDLDEKLIALLDQ